MKEKKAPKGESSSTWNYHRAGHVYNHVFDTPEGPPRFWFATWWSSTRDSLAPGRKLYTVLNQVKAPLRYGISVGATIANLVPKAVIITDINTLA